MVAAVVLVGLGAVAVALELTIAPSLGEQAACLALMAVASGCAAIVAMRRLPPGGCPWLLCWLVLQLGGFASAFATRAAGDSVSYPSLADAMWLLAGIALIMALVVQIRVDVPVRDQTAVLDATIIATGVGAIVWATVMAPSASANATSVLARSVAVAYPTLDIATLGLIGYLWTATRDRKDLPLLASGVALLLVSDTLFALGSTFGLESKGWTIRPSALLAVLVLAAVLVEALAAASQRCRGRGRERTPGSSSPPRSHRSSWQRSRPSTTGCSRAPSFR